jgi:GT2 family glycosyltransferase
MPILDSSGDSVDISIVIVSFNTRNVLRECLQSIERESAGLRIEILVVDNHSSDGSPEMVEKEFPQVRLFRCGVNLGFASANNVALEVARGRYSVLLNSDAFLCPNALTLAVQHMDQRPSVGLAGARLVGRDNSWQPSARMFPSLLTDFFVLTGLASKFPKSHLFGSFDRTWADPMLPAQTDWVPGAFSIIRTEALTKVGPFDPEFFLYSEEVDLCGVRDLVLARYRRDSHRRRVVAPGKLSGDVIGRRTACPLAHAQHAALLPQASRILGMGRETPRTRALPSHSIAEPFQQ